VEVTKNYKSLTSSPHPELQKSKDHQWRLFAREDRMKSPSPTSSPGHSIALFQERVWTIWRFSTLLPCSHSINLTLLFWIIIIVVKIPSSPNEGIHTRSQTQSNCPSDGRSETKYSIIKLRRMYLTGRSRRCPCGWKAVRMMAAICCREARCDILSFSEEYFEFSVEYSL
jgi:hypothetical protein